MIMNDDKDGINLLTMLMVPWKYQSEIVELHWNIQAIFFLERPFQTFKLFRIEAFFHCFDVTSANSLGWLALLYP